MSTAIEVRGIRKIFLAVSSMIVTGFLMKSYSKLREKPGTKEEIYRRMRAAYARVRNRAELDAKNATFNRMSITDNRFDTSDPYGIKMTWDRWRRGCSCD